MEKTFEELLTDDNDFAPANFTIAIDEFPDDEDENKQLSWKRCENCELI